MVFGKGEPTWTSIEEFMITSRSDLHRYLESDRVALKRKGHFGFLAWLRDPIWKYERLMRKREYHLNTQGRSLIKRLVGKYYGWRLSSLGLKLGFTITPNCFGEGLAIWHYGSIIVHSRARIGKNAQINSGVVIGKDDAGNVPVIGDNFKCQPGAKVCGKIVLGDNVRVGLNAVVTHSFPEGNCVLVGVPARPLVRKG